MSSCARALVVSLVVIACETAACATFGARLSPEATAARSAVFNRARVWRQTNVRAMNLKEGPQPPGAFRLGATVVCSYREKQLGGNSPKFACVIGSNDEVKVKFGGTNGEVYGEVLATRLLWALGFGADRMYSVSVVCHGCPSQFGGIELPNGDSRFDPAVIERKMQGSEWPREDGGGWSWKELDAVNAAGGAPRAHRDALKLLAVFLQHTDSKPEQQRIVCLPLGRARTRESCDSPFLMINDAGLTFGRANRFNANDAGSVNLVVWRQTPVWKDPTGCIGNLPKSFTGTLEDPVISEEGRRFLAALLGQLSDRQIRDLFEAARVHLRVRNPGDPSSGFATVEEWVAAFKQKRTEIAQRRCAEDARRLAASTRAAQ
jgi:hypothetical protein